MKLNEVSWRRKMNFSEKELQLAANMKEAGLKWKPTIGDWFTSLHPDATPSFLCVKVDNPWLIHTHGEGHIDASIWLPSWHQCREIMRKAGYKVNEVFEKTINNVTMVYVVYFRDGIEIARSGHTDLEAMYKVILLWVLDAPKREGVAC